MIKIDSRKFFKTDFDGSFTFSFISFMKISDLKFILMKL